MVIILLNRIFIIFCGKKKFLFFLIVLSLIRFFSFFEISEHCGSGSLKDFKLPIIDKQLLNRIIFQLTLALEKLHQMNIIHRDIKIENILFDSNGFLKLCDFGSATDKSYKPDHNWTPMQRSLLEDEVRFYFCGKFLISIFIFW